MGATPGNDHRLRRGQRPRRSRAACSSTSCPRKAATTFQGSFFGTATNSSFQGEQLHRGARSTRACGRRTAQAPCSTTTPPVGGPINRDKLWFYSSTRFQAQQELRRRALGEHQRRQSDRVALRRRTWPQAVFDLTSNTANTRLTWQASPRNKFNVYFDNSGGDYGFTVPPSRPSRANHWSFPRLRTGTVGWSSPRTNRLLLDAQLSIHAEDIRNFYPVDPADPFRTLIAVTEQGGLIPGLTYRGLATRCSGTTPASRDERHRHLRVDGIGYLRDRRPTRSRSASATSGGPRATPPATSPTPRPTGSTTACRIRLPSGRHSTTGLNGGVRAELGALRRRTNGRSSG